MKKLEKKHLEQIAGGLPQYTPTGDGDEVINAVSWLRKNGYWHQIVYTGKKYGRMASLDLLKKYCDENLANEIIDDYFPIG